MLVAYSLLGLVFNLNAQSDYTYTKAFDEKLEKYGLEYILPEDMWLHPIPHKDEYDDYDLVLYSEDQDLEVRYIFRDSTSSIASSSMPQFEFYRSILDFASNETETNKIVIQDVPPETAKNMYNADWCLIAEFSPKKSISLLPRARILGIYKENKGLIFCMIFYKNDLPVYFDSPIKFVL